MALTERESLALDSRTPCAAVVEALLERHDILLTLLPAKSVALSGARALFDEQLRAICAERVADEGEQAVLVVHEVAHSILHPSSAQCASDDIDGSRPVERAQLGLQRIDSYGARERRELQANVFAREFLLPRPHARRLHVDEGLTASAISELVRLPLDLVRQQLLDAVLLPTAELEKKPAAPRPAQPDPSQDTAADHRGSALLLEAGPGTGKTRTLVKRVLSLLAEGRDPSALLVLTFSNRAAGELFDRLADATPSASKIWIGTFHAFGLDVVRRYHDRLGLSADPPLFDRSDAIEVLQDLLPTLSLVHYRNLWDPLLDLKDIVNAIARAKDELVDAKRYRQLATAMLAGAHDAETREAAEKCVEIADVYDRYEVALAERGAVDFGDLIMRPALLIESVASIREEIRMRHRHVLVDEYQDVNRASARLLAAVAGDGSRLWVVGDARQSIYRFRGASSENMRRFVTDYPESETSRLAVNYRSSDEIVRTFTSFSRTMTASDGAQPLVLTSSSGVSGQNPETRVVDAIDDEAGAIAGAIRQLEAAGVSLRTQAVLCRTNRRVNELATALTARGIPVLHLGSFFEREDVRDVLSLMSLLVERAGSGLVRVGASARYPLSLDDVALATRALAAEARGSARENLGKVAADGRLSESGRASLERLRSDLEDFSFGSSPWVFLATLLLDKTRLVAELAVRDDVESRMRCVALWQLLNFLREPRATAHGVPIRRVLDQVRQLVLLAEDRDLRHLPAAALHMDAVRLMTVHASKGLEFEAVHVPGLTVASFPSSNRAASFPIPDGLIETVPDANSTERRRTAHAEEEECLFFVALSRAKTHLRLYRARKQSNGKTRNSSPFLQSTPTIERTDGPSLAAPGTKADAIDVNWPKGQAFRAEQIELFEKCPRRFFYTHVLGLRTVRSATPFSQAHECLFELIKWIVVKRSKGVVSSADATQELDRIWTERGPADHGFAVEYRRIADRLAAALVRHAVVGQHEPTKSLPLKLDEGTILVEPHEIVRLPDGTVVLRHIRLGHRRADEYERLIYALHRLAARVAFGPRARAEALHLASDITEPVEMTEKVLANRNERANTILKQLIRGQYPATPDAFTCPRCPHFFVCAAAPQGTLELPQD